MFINSTRDEKELSRIKKKLKQVYRRDGLVVRTMCCKCVKPGSIPGSVESILYQASLLINSTRDEKESSRIKKGVTASVGEVV